MATTPTKKAGYKIFGRTVLAGVVIVILAIVIYSFSKGLRDKMEAMVTK